MENTFDPERFTDLPFELQEYIIAQRPELIQTFSRVDPVYSGLLEHDLMEQICNRDVSQKESDKADISQRITGYLYQNVISDDNILFVLDIYIKGFFNQPTNILNVVQYTNEGVYLSDGIEGDYQSNPIHDSLLMRHSILKNRLNCMKINPNFAKDAVLKVFNTEVESFRSDFKYNDTNTYPYIIKYYLTFLLDVYTFNILIDLNILLLQDIPNNIDTIIHDIDTMIDLIRKAILVL